jgi:hypothetical protein
MIEHVSQVEKDGVELGKKKNQGKGGFSEPSSGEFGVDPSTSNMDFRTCAQQCY